MDVLILFTYKFVEALGTILRVLIFVRILMSWFTMGKNPVRGPISFFIYSSTEPIFSFFRKFPHRIGMFDLAPLIALIVVDLSVYFILDFLTKLI